MYQRSHTVIAYPSAQPPGLDKDHTPHFGALVSFLMNAVWEYGLLGDMTREEAALAAELSSLHDAGKLLLPSSIRDKPGKLTAEEFAIVKRHPVWGAAIAPYFLPKRCCSAARVYVTEICRHHHERWDGGGYPDGLKGGELPNYVQVIGLADAYDALAAPRTYKPAMEHAAAARLIRSGGCGAFAPWLLHVFAEHADRIEADVYAARDRPRSEIA